MSSPPETGAQLVHAVSARWLVGAPAAAVGSILSAVAVAATILICDNEESSRALVRASLAKGGYTFAEARDGEESLDLARGLRPRAQPADHDKAAEARADRFITKPFSPRELAAIVEEPLERPA